MAPANTLVVRNRLLRLLPPDVLAALLPMFRIVTLSSKQTVYRSGAVIEAAYFLESGLVSLLAHMDDGTQPGVGVVGAEGLIGMTVLSGIDTSFTDATVQMQGSALQMGIRDFRREAEANAPFRRLLMRYAESLQNQVMQTASCNMRHGLQRRLARWLLMAHDRANKDELPLTHEFMAVMLGVRRASITVAAGNLQKAGLIQYSGGRINVRDRTNLEAASCECYRVVENRFSTLFDANN